MTADSRKTKAQLLEEIARLRERLPKPPERASDQVVYPRSQHQSALFTSFDDAPIGLFRIGLDGEYAKVNHELAQLYGYDSPQKMMEAVSGAAGVFVDEERFVNFLETVKKEGRVNDFDAMAKRKDETRFWSRRNARLYLDNQGKPLFIEGTVTDISSIKRTEEELRKSRDAIRVLLDASHDFFILLELDGAVVAVNWACARWLGLSPQEIVGSNVFSLHQDKIVEVYRQKMVEVVGSGNPASFVTEVDGETFDTAIYPIFDQYETVYRLAVYFHDITAIKLAERARRESEVRYKTLFDNAGDAIFVFDLHGRYLDVNRVACQLLGYERRELMNMSPADHTPRQQSLAHESMLEKLSRDGFLTYETKLVRKDGSLVPMDFSARLIEHRGTLAALCVGRDMTERIRTQEALLEAKEAAEAASRTKSEFLANISHEIRTPMSSIIGLTELTLKADLPEKQRADLVKVRNSSELLLNIINDLLDFSKIESGKLTLERTNFDLVEVLRNVVETLLYQAAKKNLDFSYSIGADVPKYLVGDPYRIRQILLNLAGNAIKFTPSGKVKISVRSLDEDLRKKAARAMGPEAFPDLPATPSGLRPAGICFTVTDTGIGISCEDLERIFDSFTQADGAHDRKYGGTGLGLTICRQLARLMGGTVWAESDPGAGSAFSLAVYLEPGVGMDTPLTVDTQVVDATPRSERALRILLAEDNAINKDMVSKMLTANGHVVEAVENGQQAVDAVRTDNYDLVLMDLQMPVMDGFTATRLIRELPGEKSGLPIVALTAHAFSDYRQKCLDAGMNEYVAKPIRFSTLLNTINKLTNKSGPPSTGAGDTPASRPRPDKQISGPKAASGQSIVPAAEKQDQASEADEPVVDFEVLSKNMDGNQHLIQAACKNFIRYAAAYLDQIREAVTEKNSEELDRLAHSMKSVTATFGGETARQLALSLELSGKEKTWNGVDQTLGRFEDVVRKMIAILENGVIAA